MHKQKDDEEETTPRRRRRRMNKIRIDELSGVDRPAMEPALATIMKRADGVLKRGDLVDILTSVEEGHQHGVTVRVEDGELYVMVMYAREDGAENSHDHMLAIDADGNYVVSLNEGHTHTIDSEQIRELVFNRVVNKSEYGKELELVETDKGLHITKNAASCGKSSLEDNMSDANKGAGNEALQTEITKLKSQLVTANAVLAMTSIEKSHYGQLDTASQAAFIAKSSAERGTDIEFAKTADPIEYTTSDGVELRKSAGVLMIKMAKDNDVLKKQMAAQQDVIEKSALEKRAETDLGNMPGTVEVRAAILKSVDGIEDEGVRKLAHEALVAKNTEMSGAFTTSGRGFHKNADEASGNAGEELDTLAKAYATEHDVSYIDAYDVVGTANPDLLTKAVGQ